MMESPEDPNKHPVELIVHDDWSEAEPRTIPYALLYNDNGWLVLQNADFGPTRKLLETGGIVCPTPIDERAALAYCESKHSSVLPQNYMELSTEEKLRIMNSEKHFLSAVSLTSGNTKTIVDAPRGAYFIWLRTPILPSSRFCKSRKNIFRHDGQEFVCL